MLTIQVSPHTKNLLPGEIIFEIIEELKIILSDDICKIHNIERVVIEVHANSSIEIRYLVIGACEDHEAAIDQKIHNHRGKYKVEKMDGD